MQADRQSSYDLVTAGYKWGSLGISRCCSLLQVYCVSLRDAKPVAFVTFANGAEVIRAGNHSQIALQTGDFLFAGDAIVAPRPVTVCYCPEDAPGAARSYSLQGSLTLSMTPPAQGGTPLAICGLPRIAREPAEVAILPSLDELLPPHHPLPISPRRSPSCLQTAAQKSSHFYAVIPTIH
jgi:hypothetical protein